jgi:hypothetical protein
MHLKEFYYIADPFSRLRRFAMPEKHGCAHFEAALTIARTPALIASGRSGQASAPRVSGQCRRHTVAKSVSEVDWTPPRSRCCPHGFDKLVTPTKSIVRGSSTVLTPRLASTSLVIE